MSLHVIPSLPIHRWVSGKGVVFALIGLLALDGGPYVSSALAFQLSPNSLTFTAAQNGANPAPQTISLSQSSGRTKTWTVSPSASWLTISPTSGTISRETDRIIVNANVAGLGQGSYPASITVTMVSTGGSVSKIAIPVTLTLTASTSSGTIGFSPTSLAFTGTAGGTNPAGQPFTLTNSGGGTLSWTLSSNAPWLHLNIASGTTTTEIDTISASVTTSGLAAGTYNGIITVTTSGGSTKQVSVTLTLTAAALAPAVGLNTTSLGFAGTVGGTNPSAQTFAISNVGGGTLTWSANSSAAWLALSPLSGTNTGTVTATVNLAGLLAGTYTATVTVAATGATAKTIPVTLTLAASTSSGTIGFSPTSLAFAGTVGGTNPAAQPFTLTNSGGGTLSWTLSNNAAWLHLNTASGTNSGTVTASVTTSGLAAGIYNAIITVMASGSTNSPRQIPVSLTLSTTTAGTVGLAWNANSDTDLSGYKVYQGTSSGTYAAPVATIPKTTTSYTVTGLQTGTTYFFVITAYDSAGNESLRSSEVSTSIY